jgi:hypothetical protein
MHVRVLQCGDEATPTAFAARPPLLAHQTLRQPQRQTLLADPARTLEEKGLRQPASANRVC